MKMFKIVEGTEHGRAIVATQRIDPGCLGKDVFTERALMVFPTPGSNEDHSPDVPKILKPEPGPQMWSDWISYLEQPQQLKDRIFQLYTDMTCPHANAIRDYLHHYREKMLSPSSIDDEETKCKDEVDGESCDENATQSALRNLLENIEEFIKLTMVVRFNAVELQPPSDDGTGPGTYFGHGLFEMACKINHSCKPNCIWKTTQDGTSKEVRAIATIEEGEELTLDYCGNILDPTPQRRDELLATKGFVCHCDRCAAAHDDTRRFKCLTADETGCTGAHFLDQPTYSCTPSLSPCSRCGTVATESQVESLMRDEVKLVHEINALDKAADEYCIVEVQDRIENLTYKIPHPHHSLADKCYRLQGELYSVMGQYRWAAEAYAKSIDCRIAIMGNDYYSQATAFTCEKLGEVLEHVNLKESETAYQRTVRSLEMIRGDAQTDPYAKCAVKKLLAVQNRRIHEEDKDLPQDTSLEGIAEPDGGPPDTSFPCQLCGNPSMIPASSRDAQRSYCSKYHKKAHLAVLKSDPYCVLLENEEKTSDW